MALLAADFQRPAGRLSSSWFTDDLDAILAALITQAEAASSVEAAQAAWVYARAYQFLADDRALVAATTAADDVRETFSDAQFAHWQRLADAAQADFRTLSGAQHRSGVTAVTGTW